MKQKYNLFSLFSGAGGLDLGFTLSNRFDIIFGNDTLASAAKTYSTNFRMKQLSSTPKLSDLPAVFLRDVEKLDLNGLEGLEPDVVTGGPPCQDFSIVRGPEAERKGISVSRGRLYAHFVRALIHLQPQAFVFENVPGLISANNGKAYEVILEDFSKLAVRSKQIREFLHNTLDTTPKGYTIIFSDLVDASELGVPQARKRLIIVGIRKDLFRSAGCEAARLKQKVANAMSNERRLVSKYPLTPIEVFEGRPLPELEGRYEKVMIEYEGVVEEVGTPRAFDWKRSVWDKLSFRAVKDYLMLNEIHPANRKEVDKAFLEHAELLKELGYYGVDVSTLKNEDESNRLAKESKAVRERMKRIPPDENHEFVRGTDWEVEGRGISLIYRRIHPLKPSYTIVAKGGGGTWGYHYERHRGRLTNRERARLQTFPDNFVFKGTISQKRSQIGEAVPPLLAKRIAEVLSRVLKEVRLLCSRQASLQSFQ